MYHVPRTYVFVCHRKMVLIQYKEMNEKKTQNSEKVDFECLLSLVYLFLEWKEIGSG